MRPRLLPELEQLLPGPEQLLPGPEQFLPELRNAAFPYVFHTFGHGKVVQQNFLPGPQAEINCLGQKSTASQFSQRIRSCLPPAWAGAEIGAEIQLLPASCLRQKPRASGRNLS